MTWDGVKSAVKISHTSSMAHLRFVSWAKRPFVKIFRCISLGSSVNPLQYGTLLLLDMLYNCEHGGQCRLILSLNAWLIESLIIVHTRKQLSGIRPLLIQCEYVQPKWTSTACFVVRFSGKVAYLTGFIGIGEGDGSSELALCLARGCWCTWKKAWYYGINNQLQRRQQRP